MPAIAERHSVLVATWKYLIRSGRLFGVSGIAKRSTPRSLPRTAGIKPIARGCAGLDTVIPII
jgi:hypothetical protein